MTGFSSLAGPLEHHYGPAAYCPLCSRRSVLPLAQLVAKGKGSLRLQTGSARSV